MFYIKTGSFNYILSATGSQPFELFCLEESWMSTVVSSPVVTPPQLCLHIRQWCVFCLVSRRKLKVCMKNKWFCFQLHVPVLLNAPLCYLKTIAFYILPVLLSTSAYRDTNELFMKSFSPPTFRSIARLALGNYAGALGDAREALRLAPRYPEVSKMPIIVVAK